MKIGINTLSATYGGGLVNSTNLIKSLIQIDDMRDYCIFVKASKRILFENRRDNIKYIECSISDHSPLKRIYWENKVLPALLKKYRIDGRYTLYLFKNAGTV